MKVQGLRFRVQGWRERERKRESRLLDFSNLLRGSGLEAHGLADGPPDEDALLRRGPRPMVLGFGVKEFRSKARTRIWP